VKQLKELCSQQMRVQVWERKPFATAGYNQRFIYSMFTEDTLDEKGQARDTRVHVTLECFLTRQKILQLPLAEIPSCSRTGLEKILSKKYV